jgi:putative PIN family toxin of toxin-antitoxin system
MIKTVIDTNVIVSAIFFKGKPRQVLESALKGYIKIYITEDIILELKDVLHKNKFNLSSELIENIISELISLAEWVEPSEHFHVIENDPSDNIFLDCALAGKVEYIISGDKHLLEIEKWQNIEIVNPDKLLQILERNK